MDNKITFSGFTDYFHFAKQHNWAITNNGPTSTMMSKITQMNSECACRRNQFIPQIENLYREVPVSLSNIERASIKQALGASEVHFENKGTTLLIF